MTKPLTLKMLCQPSVRHVYFFSCNFVAILVIYAKFVGAIFNCYLATGDNLCKKCKQTLSFFAFAAILVYNKNYIRNA